MEKRNEFQVAFIGAGPVGCVGALLMARAGFSVLLVETATELPVDLRASTFHPPTLDMLGSLGLTRFLIDAGLIASRYQYRDRNSGLYAEFDLGVLDGIVEHPFRVQCEQFKLTRHVVSLLEAMPNAQVRMGTTLTHYTQDEQGVTARLEAVGAIDEIRCDYLIGADGSRSQVRQVMGTEFEGFTYPEQFLVVATDNPLEEQLPNLAHVNYISAADEWCVVLRVVDSWRVLFPTDPNADSEQLKDEQEIEARLQRLAPRETRYNVLHKSLYRIHQRVAKSYRQGRVLLAGDAAHLNNPLGGMGMNGGLHDVFNLSDKLIAVLKDTAPDSLLDVYDRQRRTVTWDFVQKQTIENKRRIENADETARIDRIHELRRIASDKPAAIDYLKHHNMIDALECAAAIR